MAMDLAASKAIAMLVLGLGSFIAAMLPSCFSERSRQKHPLLISTLLCFGAGVLLATSLVHMLPEAREKFPDNAELMFCVGFFIVYLVDEVVHLFYGSEGLGHDHNHQATYGSGEHTSLLTRTNECNGGRRDEELCHVTHTAPCNRTSSGVVGLLGALFVHSLLEGLAIGLQDNSTQVLLLLGAVSCHKFVVGFCLGAELCATMPTRLCLRMICVALFSGGSVAGIAAGAGLDSVSALTNSPAVPVMQALAGGTLLYVTVSEVLPRERSRWHERKRSAGIAQFFAVTVGFVVMYFSTTYFDHDGA